MSPFLSKVSVTLWCSQSGLSDLAGSFGWFLSTISWLSTLLPPPEVGWSGYEEDNQMTGALPGRGGRQKQISSNRRYPSSLKLFIRLPSKTFRKGKHSSSQLCWKHLSFYMWVWVKEQFVSRPSTLANLSVRSRQLSGFKFIN